MNAFMNVHLNTIRSVLLKDIYDLLYPVLQDKPISRNENILYGMLSKLSEFISAFKEDTVPAITDVGAISIARKKITSYLTKFKKLFLHALIIPSQNGSVIILRPMFIYPVNGCRKRRYSF